MNGNVSPNKIEEKKKTTPVDSSLKPGLGNEKQEKEKPKNSKQEVPRERMNDYQNDEDPLDDVQNLFNCGCDCGCDSFGLSYFYQNGIDGQSISIGYQKSTKISSACPLAHLQQKGIKGTTRKYKYQNSIDISYVRCVNNEPRTLVANNKATVEKHNNDDNILAFDQGKVTESRDKNDEYQEFANNQKPVKIGQGNCYQDGGDSKEHKPKEFVNYQKHGTMSHVIECNSRISCINKVYNLRHWYGDRIRVEENGNEVRTESIRQLIITKNLLLMNAELLNGTGRILKVIYTNNLFLEPTIKVE